jgi:hypothetical protein
MIAVGSSVSGLHPSNRNGSNRHQPVGFVSLETVYSVAWQNGLLYDGLGGVFNGGDLNRAGSLAQTRIVSPDDANHQFVVAEYRSDTARVTLSVYDQDSFTPLTSGRGSNIRSPQMPDIPQT